MSKIRGYTVDEIKRAKRGLIEMMPGLELYIMLTKKAPSGMSRKVRLFSVYNHTIVGITYLVAAVTGKSLTNDGEIVLHGCGMDVALPITMELSEELFGNKFSVQHIWL